METEFAAGLGQIILFDLILSGDNAVVIGVVASRLQGRQRRLAILFGAGGAVVLRIAFASIATLLLQIPIISLVGGLALFWVGWRLLAPHGDEEHHETATTFWQALRLIILADVVMSLDNVLTIAGAAHGDILLLVIGLALSIPLLFVGSGLIAFATERVPLIIYAGSALIFRIAGGADHRGSGAARPADRGGSGGAERHHRACPPVAGGIRRSGAVHTAGAMARTARAAVLGPSVSQGRCTRRAAGRIVGRGVRL